MSAAGASTKSRAPFRDPARRRGVLEAVAGRHPLERGRDARRAVELDEARGDLRERLGAEHLPPPALPEERHEPLVSRPQAAELVHDQLRVGEEAGVRRLESGHREVERFCRGSTRCGIRLRLLDPGWSDGDTVEGRVGLDGRDRELIRIELQLPPRALLRAGERGEVDHDVGRPDLHHLAPSPDGVLDEHPHANHLTHRCIASQNIRGRPARGRRAAASGARPPSCDLRVTVGSLAAAAGHPPRREPPSCLGEREGPAITGTCWGPFDALPELALVARRGSSSSFDYTRRPAREGDERRPLAGRPA